MKVMGKVVQKHKIHNLELINILLTIIIIHRYRSQNSSYHHKISPIIFIIFCENIQVIV